MMADENVFYLTKSSSIGVSNDVVVFRYSDDHDKPREIDITETPLGVLLIKVVVNDPERYGGR